MVPLLSVVTAPTGRPLHRSAGGGPAVTVPSFEVVPSGAPVGSSTEARTVEEVSVGPVEEVSVGPVEEVSAVDSSLRKLWSFISGGMGQEGEKPGGHGGRYRTGTGRRDHRVVCQNVSI
ncbi:hypothetical protein EYF80_054189 [Liparis tanakae]|uniref:Uncharacterized protein n=1 Tax=Liparis tanakae TaxID=230148 RepID=A0A4Z2F420_9TELE|nr:hypothetical protein EYF80_054189 [Liparis tanakae]